VALADALYYASMLDLDTVGCFCALHETRLLPKKIAYPPDDLRSSRQPAQSASENALASNELFLEIFNPSLVQPFKYRSIRFTAVMSHP
jgi:hypothetical protein